MAGSQRPVSSVQFLYVTPNYIICRLRYINFFSLTAEVTESLELLTELVSFMLASADQHEIVKQVR